MWYLQTREVRHVFGGASVWPNTVKALVLTVFTTLLAFPFFWMAVATFKQNLDLYATENNPFLFNLPPTLDHLAYLFDQTDNQLAFFLVIQICLAALLLSLWFLRHKVRLSMFFQLGMALLSSFLVFRQLHHSLGFSFLTLLLVTQICISAAVVWHLWRPYTALRIAIISLLILNALEVLIALFRYLLQQTGYLRWLGNTAFVGVIVVVITLLLSIPAAYALARLTGRWGERLGIAIFLTYLVPPTLLFIPLSRVVAILGLQDSLWSLVLVYPSITVPFSIWLLMGFFKSIPRELEDAAMVDGLTRFGAFIKLVIPISISGILTVVIFAFTLVTQEFVYAVTFISPKAKQMVGVGVPNFLVLGDVYYWGALMAACLIASLPIAFFYNLFLDRFIAGFTVGAVKG